MPGLNNHNQVRVTAGNAVGGVGLSGPKLADSANRHT